MRSLITIPQRSENGCRKRIILVWNWVRIWGTGRHTPTKNSEEYPPPPPGFSASEKRKIRTEWFYSSSKWEHKLLKSAEGYVLR